MNEAMKCIDDFNHQLDVMIGMKKWIAQRVTIDDASIVSAKGNAEITDIEDVYNSTEEVFEQYLSQTPLDMA